ncbi:MAG: ACP S-malonyltransferase [Casimicrobiaceae bacterium]|nr:ACP S-malonyltransferase [Casimicrobiaceae bacterium]
MKLAFVFPGQGSQSVGMMSAYGELAPIAETLAEADQALGEPLSQLMAQGPAELLNQTRNTQPAMLAADVALWRAWVRAGGLRPALVAGHSLGEYAALVAAGALDFPAAMRLVAARAEAMQAAVPAGAGAMAAVLGLELATLEAVCAEAAQGEVVSCCNLNAPGQIVIGGHRGAVERAAALAKARGAKRVVPIMMSVPSHCDLMRPAAEALEPMLARTAFRPPAMAVIHNATVEVASDADAIRRVLAVQLYRPVRWIETIEAMAAQGVTHVVECGPGKVLAAMVKRIAPHLEVFTLSDRAAFDAALTSLKGLA